MSRQEEGHLQMKFKVRQDRDTREYVVSIELRAVKVHVEAQGQNLRDTITDAAGQCVAALARQEIETTRGHVIDAIEMALLTGLVPGSFSSGPVGQA